MLNWLTKKIDQTFYPKTTRFWDDERFIEVVKRHLKPEFQLLEFGAGRGKTDLFDLRGNVAHVTGVDIDESVLENPNLNAAQVIVPGQTLNFPDHTFDLVFSCNVLEHVDAPDQVFPEIYRVLKPGGLFVSKTTNQNHYVAWVARMTPLSFHKRYNRMRGRAEVDTFPTKYKCNTRRRIRSLARQSGFEVEWLEFWEWRPEYLRMSPFTYVFGIAYEKIVNATSLLAPLRAVMVVGLRKPL
jgi:SAM-dependent methyltransferase